MYLMLALLLLCLLIGLWAPRFGRRESLAVALLATVTTALYYFLAHRFM